RVSPTREQAHRNNEGPQKEVPTTRPFYMGAYEVTQQQYEAAMGSNPARFTAANGGGPDHPVEQVSWDEAVEFCLRLSERPEEKQAGRVYHLPTEAEWEYACRGGASSPFHFGNALSSTQANFNGNVPYGGAPKGPYLLKTTPVGSYAPNAFGLYDMHGNVYEWCSDRYNANYYQNSPKNDPRGPPTGDSRVLRSGSWD